jgi:LysM repeat protein
MLLTALVAWRSTAHNLLMGHGPRDGDDRPDAGDEFVRPVRRGRPTPSRDPQPRDGRPVRREPTDPRGVRRQPTDPRGVRRAQTDPSGVRRIPPDARGARREHTDPRGSRYEAGHYSDPYADPYADRYGQQPGQYSDPYGQPPTQHGDPNAQGYGEQEWSEPEAWGETQGWGEPRARGGGGGGYDERPGILPEWLPTLPTVGIATFVVLLAFLFGRLTAGGGGDSSTTSSTRKESTATTTTLSTTPSTHIVGRGETLSAVASSLGIAPDALAAYNGITNINHVFVGQVLKIPPPGYTPPTTAGSVTTLATTATTKKGK